MKNTTKTKLKMFQVREMVKRSYLFNYYDCNSKKIRGYDKDIKRR